MMSPRLRFHQDQIAALASRYQYQLDDANLMKLQSSILERGYLTKNEIKKIAYWKAPRSAAHADKNQPSYVTEITRFALTTEDERARIQSLTLLDGVSWPTASVILHLFHRDPYPILDFRALWSLSLDVPVQYRFDFWLPYVRCCRDLAQRANVDMRTLDRALWQYSKENQ